MADITEHRAYPLPVPSNTLAVDVGNLRELGSAIDADMHAALSRIAMGTQGAASQAFAYDGSGRISTITTVVDGDTITQAFAYNPDGTVSTITTTHLGRTRIEAFAYSGGAIQAITTTETP